MFKLMFGFICGMIFTVLTILAAACGLGFLSEAEKDTLVKKTTDPSKTVLDYH